MTGKIFDIQRFCTSDGPGIRTTVFFKGCPLNCAWCHNPESQSTENETLFYRDKCTECGRCKRGLPCPNGARRECGRIISAEDVMKKVREDKLFYKNSGGGLTLSGGEPLAQADFAVELLKLARADGIHTAIETCGFASRENMLRLAEHTDLFLFDYKLSEREKHKAFTGAYNDQILENLRLLDSLGKEIVLRCPIIPDVNDNEEHICEIAKIANGLGCISRIELEPYHDYGIAKYEALERKPHVFTLPDKKSIEKLANILKQNTDKPVKIL